MSAEVEQIKARLDIADVVREYVTLKPAGVHLKACCPFHQEKSPSFMLSRQRQSWHCFGCNEGGDIFTFVQRIENIDFREALKLLAEKAGVELTHTQRGEINRSQRARLLELIATAAQVYARILREHAGAAGARAYLDRRGMSTESRTDFLVGCAPTAWDVMTKYLLGKGYSIEDCVAAGLTIVKQEAGARAFDRFRARIMFPIGDAQGRVIGFTGRVIDETQAQHGGKYVNTPETPLFHKGNVVYGLHRAKQTIKEAGYAVLVEGQMDVIACHAAGMKQVVACSGTALTTEQLRLLHRYTDELRMAFDADAAGQTAAERSIADALAEGFVVKIIGLPIGAGKDADECLKKNPAVWHDAVANAHQFMDDILMRCSETPELRADPRKKDAASKKIISFIELIPSAVERDHWIQRAAVSFGTSADALHEMLLRSRAGTPSYALRDAASAPVQDERRVALQRILEERLCALIQDQIAACATLLHQFSSEIFQDDHHRTLYTAWQQHTSGALQPPTTDPMLELLVSAVYGDLDTPQRVAEAYALAKRLQTVYYTAQRELLLHEIKRAEHAGDEEKTRALLARYQTFVI